MSPTRNCSHLHLSGTSRPKHETFFRCSWAHSWMYIHGMRSAQIYETKPCALCTRPHRLPQRPSPDISVAQWSRPDLLAWWWSATPPHTHSSTEPAKVNLSRKQAQRCRARKRPSVWQLKDSIEDIMSDDWGSALDLFSLNMGGPRRSVSSLGGLGQHLSTTRITR